MIREIELKKASSSTLSAVMLVSASLRSLYWVPLRLLEGSRVIGPLVVIAPFIMHYISKTVIDIKEPNLAFVIKGLGFALYTIGLIEKTAVRATLLAH